jgi:hypothetical protein
VSPGSEKLQSETLSIFKKQGVSVITHDHSVTSMFLREQAFWTLTSKGPNFIINQPIKDVSKIQNNLDAFLLNVVQCAEASTRMKDTNEVRSTLPSWRRVVPLAPLTIRKKITQFFESSIAPLFPELEDFAGTLASSMQSYMSRKSSPSNLTKKERKILSKIRKSGNFILTNADKNLGPVIATSEATKKECERLLFDDQGTYMELDVPGQTRQDVCQWIFKDLDKLCNYLDRNPVLREEVKEFRKHGKLAMEKGKLGSFYPIWKLHKTPIASRPIVPSYDTITASISRYLHATLMPHVFSHQNVLKDSKAWVEILEQANMNARSVPQLIVTGDVIALYPSIQLEQGLSALRGFLMKKQYATGMIEDLVSMAKFVLTHNVFEAPLLGKERFFLQKVGTAMGTAFSVVYSIIFMIQLEEPVVLQAIQEGFLQPGDYKRFIDDLIILWSGPPQALVLFLKSLEARFSNIGFTWSIDLQGSTICTNATSCAFMDLFIWKSDGLWSFKVYGKEGAAYAYIPQSSCHPSSCMKGWIKAEAIRIVTHSSSEVIAQNTRRLFVSRLLRRGYKLTEIIRIINLVRWSDRAILMQGSKGKPNCSKNYARCRLVLPYAPDTHGLQVRLPWSSDAGNSKGLPQHASILYSTQSNLKNAFQRT